MKKWRTVKQSIVFDAAPYVRVSKQTVQLPNGLQIDNFYQVHLRSFAIVLPMLPTGEVLALRQYKHGLGRVSLTFPAGFIEQAEDPEVGAKRELLEETGFEAGRLHYLGEFVDNGNQRGCTGHYYFAENCTYKKTPNSGDLEEMEVQALAPADVDIALQSGEIGIVHHACVWAMARARGLIQL